MTNRNEFTHDGIFMDAVDSIKEYIKYTNTTEKPTNKEEREKLFKDIIESPADWTGYYEPEITFEGIDWGSINCFKSEFISSSIRFAKNTGYYREDEPWVWETMSAIRMYSGWLNFEEIVDTAWKEAEEQRVKRYERITEMLKVWKEEEDKMWKQSLPDGWSVNADSNPNHAKALLLDDIINILEDPVYAEDRLEVYGIK